MLDTVERPREAEGTNDVTHFDVLIAGAGISGIGSAVHLKEQCPDKTYAILDSKDSFGGTWDTHKYPGVRSDSDLYTFGYRFKPWVGAPIASAEEILKYMGEVIEENDLNPHIRYGHTITHCSFSRATNLWTVEALSKADGKTHSFTCNFLWMCQGYYNHNDPYIPDWPGRDTYKGEFIHAMKWTPETDVTGKRVIVIGSGATAATIIPAMAGKAAHVTMLQRSPTYFFCSPNQNELADRLREIGIDEPTIHRVVRQQILYDQDVLTKRCLAEPDAVVEELRALIRMYGGEDFPFEPHFTPKYRPWQQRLAFCPDGDIFQAAAKGRKDERFHGWAARNSGDSQPSKTCATGPVIQTPSSRQSISSTPPSRSSVTCRPVRPRRWAATAVAQAPDPHARVMPAPRSQTRIRRWSVPITLANSTLVRWG